MHELRPLDKSVYRSFVHHWVQELIKYNQLASRKTTFNVILSQVWYISTGFRATGLYPYNTVTIPEEAIAALSEPPNPIKTPNQRQLLALHLHNLQLLQRESEPR